MIVEQQNGYDLGSSSDSTESDDILCPSLIPEFSHVRRQLLPSVKKYDFYNVFLNMWFLSTFTKCSKTQ